MAAFCCMPIPIRRPTATLGPCRWTAASSPVLFLSDGKELHYPTANRNLMAILEAAGGSAFQPGNPTALFQAPPNPAGWDVTADGGKFLFNVPTGETAQTPFTLAQNWMSLLRK